MQNKKQGPKINNFLKRKTGNQRAIKTVDKDRNNYITQSSFPGHCDISTEKVCPVMLYVLNNAMQQR